MIAFPQDYYDVVVQMYQEAMTVTIWSKRATKRRLLKTTMRGVWIFKVSRIKMHSSKHIVFEIHAIIPEEMLFF